MEKKFFFEAMRVVWKWARESVQETDSELFFFHLCNVWSFQRPPCIWENRRGSQRVIAQRADTQSA